MKRLVRLLLTIVIQETHFILFLIPFIKKLEYELLKKMDKPVMRINVTTNQESIIFDPLILIKYLNVSSYISTFI